MEDKEQLIKHLSNLEIPQVAGQWLIDLWDAIQDLDDWYDGDETENKERAIFNILVALPTNPFYLQNASVLSSSLSQAVLKWVAANKLENAKECSATSFVWRAAYYDIILQVVQIVHGTEAAMRVGDYVAKMYGEKLEDYLKEFDNA